MSKYNRKTFCAHNSAHLFARPADYEDVDHITTVRLYNKDYSKYTSSWSWDRDAIIELGEWAKFAAVELRNGVQYPADFKASNSALVRIGRKNGDQFRLNFQSDNTDVGWWWTAEALDELADWLQVNVIDCMEDY